MRFIKGLILGLPLALSFINSTHAQTAGTGALTGRVTDSANDTVQRVRVTTTNNASGEVRTVVTNDDGNYSFPLLSPGSYDLRFEATGFKVHVKHGVVINVTETARFDTQLQTGELRELVVVTSEPELLQTESSTLGRVNDSKQITSLPLVSRNFTELITHSPGISVNVNNASDVGPGNGGLQQGNFRVNGANGGDNNFQLDGIGVNDLQAGRVFSAGIPIPNPDFSARSFFSEGNNQATLAPPFLNIGSSLPGFPVLLKSRFRSLSLAHNYVLSGNLANQLSFGFLGTLGRTTQQEAFSFQL